MPNREKTRVLVVDDEEMIRYAFGQFLADEGYEPLLASDGASALGELREHRPEILFLDYRLPGKDGLSLLKEIRSIDGDVPVVFMTAFGQMDVAIKAMQLGAYEYLTKPLDLEKIRSLMERILQGREFLAKMANEAETEGTPGTLGRRMVGQGPVMQEVFKTIGLLTMQDVTVLITGESGVGKELVARAIHDNSPRAGNAFVAVNCGAMPETLLEAEMFGHEKGAFTGADSQKPGRFEVANGGTIFLDEIGELYLPLQVKLLRVLQEKSFERVGGHRPVRTDARVIAATNKDLKEEVGAGRFRKDLFYRLHLVQIHLPPLRERKEDIPILVRHFVHKANLEMGRQVKGVTEEAMKRLESYPWPGNVRELEHQIKRAMVLSREDVLSEHHFDLGHEESLEAEGPGAGRLSDAVRKFFLGAIQLPDPERAIYNDAVEVLERTLIEESLARTQGNQLQAALLLGMNRSTLRKKIKQYRM
jgi:nitrogen regulation protein NR(I)